MKNLKRSVVLASLVMILCMLAIAKSFGQTIPEVRFETMDMQIPVEELSYQYLLGHKVFLREKPSLKAKRLAVLDIGTRLVLREESENPQEINGITSPWYRTTVGNVTGWIWGGMIAQDAFGSGADYEVKFVYGLESNTTTEHGVNETKYQLRAFKDGVQLDKIVLDSLAAIPVAIENIGNKGLFNVEDIIAIDLIDSNFGYMTGTSYVFWNNGKFTNVANLRDYETDSYAKSEYFVFPSDMRGIKSILELKTTIVDKRRAYADPVEPLDEISVEDKVAKRDKITSGDKLVLGDEVLLGNELEYRAKVVPGNQAVNMNRIAKQYTKRTSTFYTWNGYELIKKEFTPVASEDAVASTLHR